jgi:hypothetical protein
MFVLVNAQLRMDTRMIKAAPGEPENTKSGVAAAAALPAQRIVSCSIACAA